MKLEYKETQVTAKYVIKFWAPVDRFLLPLLSHSTLITMDVSLVRQMFKVNGSQLKYQHFLSSFPVTINKAYILQKILLPDNTLGYSGYSHIAITKKKTKLHCIRFHLNLNSKCTVWMLFELGIFHSVRKHTHNLWAILVLLANFFKSQMMFITFVQRFIEIADRNLNSNWIVHLPILATTFAKKIIAFCINATITLFCPLATCQNCVFPAFQPKMKIAILR